MTVQWLGPTPEAFGFIGFCPETHRSKLIFILFFHQFQCGL